MNKPALFCLRAAASRAKRRTDRFVAYFYRQGAPVPLYDRVKRECARAEVIKYRYYDAAYEAQRHGLSRLAA